MSVALPPPARLGVHRFPWDRWRLAPLNKRSPAVGGYHGGYSTGRPFRRREVDIYLCVSGAVSEWVGRSEDPTGLSWSDSGRSFGRSDPQEGGNPRKWQKMALHSSGRTTAAAGRPRRPSNQRLSTQPLPAPGTLRGARGRAQRDNLKLQRRRAPPGDTFVACERCLSRSCWRVVLLAAKF